MGRPHAQKHSTYRAAVLALGIALAACGGATPPPTVTDILDGAVLEVAPYGRQLPVGDLAARDRELRGVSGLAASRAATGTLWAVSDTATKLFAIRQGRRKLKVRRVDVRGVRRFDWEDLAWFEDRGDPFLMIADVGTNRPGSKARRRNGEPVGQLHIVREPRADDDRVDVLRTITFTLPCEEAADIESVAVDGRRREVLLVQKRARAKRVLVLDLDQNHHDVDASAWTPVALPELYAWERQRLGLPARSLYQTTWRRNPTGMDLLGARAVLLTNRHAYIYRRDDQQSWRDALASPPQQLQIPFAVELPGRPTVTVPADANLVLPQREAICFSPDGAVVHVASEQRDEPGAWLVRFERR